MGDLLLFSIRLIGMASIVYLAILFAKTNCGKFNRIILLLHFSGALSYLLICAGYPSVSESFRLHYGPFTVVLFLMATMVPFLFMLLSRSFFAERSSMPLWAVALLVLQVVLEIVNHLQTNCDYELSSACTGISREFNVGTIIFVILPGSIATLFFVLSMLWTFKDWKTDLVEKRRQFRRGFTVMLGLFGLVMLVTEDVSLYFYPRYFPLVSNVDSILIALFFVVALLFLLATDTAVIMEALVARPSHRDAILTKPLSADKQIGGYNETQNLRQASSPDLNALNDFLQSGGYRQPGLNVARMAAKLGVPQYRLRQLINDHMGFRNFNTFLNHHRVSDACQQLSDPTNSDKSILDIALDVGFGSITSFNDAFKRTLNMTPTAYRKDKLG